MRGVEVFLNFVPAASLESMRLGNLELGAALTHQAVIVDRLLELEPAVSDGQHRYRVRFCFP